MATQQTTFNTEQGNTTQQSTGRPVIRSTEGVISSGHYLTSMAGMRMLLTGGNAFDALVAAGFAAAVVEPIASYSLAAEGVFMLYDSANGELLSLSGQGTAPGKATAEFYKSQGLERIATGPGHQQSHLSFTLPGVVHAYISLAERYGTKTIEELLAPAITYASDGIPNYEYMLNRLDSDATAQQFDLYGPGGWDVFYVNRQVPAAGTPLVQPGLTNTLRAMLPGSGNGHALSRVEGLQKARDLFYRGPVAQLIADSVARVGGIMSMEDLAAYKSQYGTPVKTTFHGYEIHGQDSWTQAPMLMQTLNMLERFDLRAMGHNSPAYIHTVAEAIKLSFGDREAHYGDPDYSTIPIDGLLSKEYAAERVQLIDPEGAYPAQRPAGNPWKYSRINGSGGKQVMAAPTNGVQANGAGADGSSHEGTTHVSVLDRHGNMVCGTISGGAFAKSAFFPELGAALSTRIEMFNCEEGHPNVVEPGKRPRTTLINYIASKDGHPVMTIGCPGGDNQAQANVQLVLNTVVFGMDPQQAVEAPRFATSSNVNSFYPHVYYPGQLDLEEGFADSTVGALKALGHKIYRTANCGLGATVSVRDPETGSMSTGADPRRACYALAL
jgi:gamma-glutamyltranspeptidase/glutathione hydrolase